MKAPRTPLTLVLADSEWRMFSAPPHSPGCRQVINEEQAPECRCCRYFWLLAHLNVVGEHAGPHDVKTLGGRRHDS